MLPLILFLEETVTSLAGSDEESGVGENSLEDIKIAAKQAPEQDDSAARAKRLAEKLRFRLKEAMAQHGGSEAFLLWLRSEDEETA